MPSKISKWLSLYKPTATDPITDVTWMYSSLRLIEDIEESLEKMTSSLLPDVCQRLFIFYTSGNADLKQFVLFFVPSLLYAYLSHSSSEDDRNSDSIQSALLTNITSLESCLIGMCRHSLADKTSVHLVNSAPPDPVSCIPNSTEPCIFHDGLPAAPEQVANNDDAVCLRPSATSNIQAVGFLIRIYVDCMNSVDLMHSLSSLLSLHSLAQFCRLCDRISNLNSKPRISASSTLLIDLLVGLDIVLFKLDSIDKRTDEIRRTTLKLRESVWSSIYDIEKRATYNCFSAPLLICQAVMHSRPAQYGARTVIGTKLPGGPPVYVDINSLIATAPPDSSTKTGSTNESTSSVIHHGSSHALTTVELITNASFKPEAPPSNINPTEQDGMDASKNVSKSTGASRSNIGGKGTVHFQAVDSRRRNNNLAANSESTDKRTKLPDR